MEELRRKRMREILSQSSVNPEDFWQAFRRIRDLRLFAYQTDLDSWALRQALIFALEFDTHYALKRVSKEHLENFDRVARKNAQELAKHMEGGR